MARIARVVAVNFPHHITQRGNRQQKVFFVDSDYHEYLNLLRIHSNKSNLEILSYCLMPNHVHLIVIPKQAESLASAIGETHRKYTRIINFRENWRGYLWQGRFNSYVLDEGYLLTATRYILLNPVRAGMVRNAWDYQWSSARHHLGIETDSLINNKVLEGMIDDWKGFLNTKVDKPDINLLKLHERTGRPLGDNTFIGRLEKILNRDLKKKKTGPKEK